ncbi:MAG: SCO family protein [Pseudomonadota bacterium]
MKAINLFLIAASALTLSACGNGSSGPTAGGASAGCSTRAYAEIGGPFELVDMTGKTVTEADFKGKPTLVFFGFTYCPDICPATLVKIKNAYDRLPENIAPPQTAFISVDHERDTPDVLARYLSLDAFPDNVVGLTGTPEQIRAVADEFIADYSRVEQPDSLADYTMDHTSLSYLMDENWELKTFFSDADSDPDSMAACLAEHMS